MRHLALAGSELKIAKLTLLTCLIAGLSLCALMMFLMTVEYDEAWIVASTGRLVNPALLPEVQTVFTTGGAYALFMGLAEAAGLPLVLVARIQAFLSLLAIMLLIERFARSWFQTAAERLFILTAVLAAPGSLALGAMGYGIALATLAFLGAVAAWREFAERPVLRIIAAGGLLGLALATRLTFIPVLPVFLIWSLANLKSREASVFAGAAVMLVGLTVCAAFLTVQFILASDGGLNIGAVLQSNLSSTGAGGGVPNAARVLSFLVKGTLFAPAALVCLVLAVTWGRRLDPRHAPAPYEPFIQILTLAALAIAGFWALKSPFQHIRYIWPAVLFFYVAGGTYLAEMAGAFLRSSDNRRIAAFYCLLAAVALFAQSFLSGVRLAAMGASSQTNSAGLELLENHFTPFWQIREQRDIAGYLQKNIEPGAMIVALGLPGEWGRLQLALLSQRNVVPLETWTDGGDAPDYFIVHRFSNLNAEGRAWLNANADPAAAVKGYKVYRAHEDASPPAPDTTIDLQLYRFSLPRALSFTGKPEAD